MPRQPLPTPSPADIWGAMYNAAMNATSDDVDTKATAAAVSTSVSALAADIAVIEGTRPDALNIRTLGAVGDGSNANAAFLAAQLAARAALRVHPLGVGSGYVGSRVIEIPAGDYLLTDLMAMLGSETQTTKISGIKFRGAGPGLTNIVFTPATAGPLVFNDYWLSISFEAMTFITTYSGATFMQSYTTHNAQAYSFREVSWVGPWLYVFDLQGSNNNSEYRFYSCGTSGMLNTGAFLYIGASGSDQFLNYWFYAFKHWSTGASIIDATYGGHFHFYGVDSSAFCSTISDTNMHYLFNLRSNTHASGVCSLTVEGLRVEAKSNYAGLFHSEWPTGNVTMECDWSSQLGSNTYGNIISVSAVNVGGAIYNIHDSNLAGGILVTYASNTNKYATRILVQNTIWHQKLTPSECVTFVYQGAGTTYTEPNVEFVNCKSDYADYSDADGYSVWDVTLSRRPPVMPIRKKLLKIGSRLGGLRDTDTNPRINLPIGALITAFTAICPAGATAEADGGVWTVNTTDGTPVVIATATVATALSAGYRVTHELAVPFLCDTRARATVTVDSTGVTSSTYSAFLILEGYW